MPTYEEIVAEIDAELAALPDAEDITPHNLPAQDPPATPGAVAAYGRLKNLTSLLRDLLNPPVQEFALERFGASTSALDNTDAALACIAAAAENGGTVTAKSYVDAPFKIEGRLLFPEGVNLKGETGAIDMLLCTDPGAGVDAGELTPSFGGSWSGFAINGGYVATRPFVIKERVSARFSEFRVWKGDETAGVLMYLLGTQNCAIDTFHLVDSGRVLVFDGGAANNHLMKGECARGWESHLEFRNDETGPVDQLDYPFYNVIDNTIMEWTQATTAAMVRSYAGSYNRLRNCPVYATPNFTGGALADDMDAAVLVNTDEHVLSSLVLDRPNIVGYWDPGTSKGARYGFKVDTGAVGYMLGRGGSMQMLDTGMKGPILVESMPDFFDIETENFDPSGAFLSFPYDQTQVFRHSLMAAAADAAHGSSIPGDTNFRHIVDANGSQTWGPGNAALDTAMYRDAANRLRMGAGDSFLVDGTWNGGKLIQGTRTMWWDASGNLRAKNGTPANDTDGTIISAATVT